MRRWCVVLAVMVVGCTGDPVGDPCTPDEVPQGGFDPSESYVETSSSGCVTRVCVVHGLEGDPSAECTSGCATEQDIEAHVYCSCRCDDDGTTEGCACPEGYACEPLGRAGSYCVRE